jgi:DNA mismatch repair protein PMS2
MNEWKEGILAQASAMMNECFCFSILIGSNILSLSPFIVRLFNQGMDIIEVSDDGCGVPPASRPLLATRYATSKIRNFEDIYKGSGLSMGFRGEALFSLACLSENLVVATRTAQEEVAQKLEFRRDGSLNVASIQPLPRKMGTTVAVVKPFRALPARRADMARRIRAERAKLFRLMESCTLPL